jgi:hypothetical protein
MLQMLSIGTECPYELLSGDYEGLSFSSLRGIRMDYQLSIDCEVGRLINQENCSQRCQIPYLEHLFNVKKSVFDLFKQKIREYSRFLRSLSLLNM